MHKPTVSPRKVKLSFVKILHEGGRGIRSKQEKRLVFPSLTGDPRSSLSIRRPVRRSLSPCEAFKYRPSPLDTIVMNKTDEEWKKELDPERYKVLRKKATERAFTGELLHNKETGVYTCGGCGMELFSSESKYDSGSGWPSFWTTLAKDRIKEIPDRTLWMKRTEIVCANCGGHLGHLFDDGPQPTGMRYCVNSLSLGFKKKDSK
jgi:peptide-methionine (R)-S-oxide reductase